MSGRDGIPNGHGDEVDQLAEVAAEYWDNDRWAIDLKLWTDGDTDAYAYRRTGNTDDGHTVEQRLSVVDGEVRAAEVIFENKQIEERDLGAVKVEA